MGEVQGTLFEPEFNRSIKVQSSDQRITSHAGAILLREIDHQLGLIESLGESLTDPRQGEKIRPSKVSISSACQAVPNPQQGATDVGAYRANRI